uniref:Putative secreted protein n=1 Tax=Anopheles darlingi TaxID=43151 RepID=A0A2M4D851_ANODA
MFGSLLFVFPTFRSVRTRILRGHVGYTTVLGSAAAFSPFGTRVRTRLVTKLNSPNLENVNSTMFEFKYLNSLYPRWSCTTTTTTINSTVSRLILICPALFPATHLTRFRSVPFRPNRFVFPF